MQKMIVTGLRLIELKLAESMYKLLPNTKVYIVDNKLIVESEMTKEDIKYISEHYEKVGKLVTFEEI